MLIKFGFNIKNLYILYIKNEKKWITAKKHTMNW